MRIAGGLHGVVVLQKKSEWWGPSFLRMVVVSVEYDPGPSSIEGDLAGIDSPRGLAECFADVFGVLEDSVSFHTGVRRISQAKNRTKPNISLKYL
jgi:hypothetical protein